MKFTITLTTLIGYGLAHPAVSRLKSELRKQTFQPSTEMIGDLITLPDSALSTVGQQVKNILLGTGNPTDRTNFYTAPPGGRNAKACRADRCCIWKHIADDMKASMFDSGTGTCTDTARGAIRLGFHDAAAWSKTSGGSGADGSILLSGSEMTRPENAALIPVGQQFTTWFDTYRSYGVTMADLIQFGAKVAAASCPGGPRIRTFIGRTDNPNPAPQFLLPPVTLDAPAIIEMFGNKTIGPGGLVALLGAHTASRQRTIDPARSGDPQDSTPGVWDTKYFTETLSPDAPANIFKFNSDISVSTDPVTGPIFQQFASNKPAWDQAYATEYIRVSLLGVESINGMVECSQVLPAPVRNGGPGIQ
ncbi:hypothetical protein OQA88_13166 [Cercophora sp. LCS_1]